MLSKGLQLFLVSLLIGSLPAQTLPAALDGASPDTGHAFVNRALLHGTLTSAVRLAFLPESQSPRQQPAATPTAQPPHGPGWARRHLLLFAGLAMTGGGAALVAGGGPGQVSGCLQAGPYGQIECTTATTWGASGRHIGGLLLLCVGVPVAIVGIFKHP
ncbi:MAG: hypothetical protein ACLQOO_13195 [Terriglobia bacterium]